MDRALAAASCHSCRPPQLLEVSPSSSSVLARAPQQLGRAGLYSCTVCTLVQWPPGCLGRDCTTVRGPGLGAGSDQSGYSDRGENTTVSVTTYSVLLQSESPAQGSVHQLAPVLACSELTCVRPLRAQKLEVKRKLYSDGRPTIR